MKNTILIILISLLAFSNAYSQPIQIEKNAGIYKFYQNEQELNTKQLATAVQSNIEAYKLVESAQLTSKFAIASIVLGGILSAIPVTYYLFDEPANWTYLRVGGVLLVLSIPISMNVNSKLLKSVNIYNNGIASTYNNYTPQMNFVINTKGIGFSIDF